MVGVKKNLRINVEKFRDGSIETNKTLMKEKETEKQNHPTLMNWSTVFIHSFIYYLFVYLLIWLFCKRQDFSEVLEPVLDLVL